VPPVWPATDVPITGLKLIVVDKTVLAKDYSICFDKGRGADPTQIAATLEDSVQLGTEARYADQRAVPTSMRQGHLKGN
jgi:hypothetical protein